MLRKLLIWGGGLVVLVAVTGGLLYFATAGATQMRVDGDRLHISGPMNLATVESFEGLIEHNSGITTVVLGDLPRADQITHVVLLGYRVQGLRLNTEVAPGAEIVGPAVWLFLGGVERRIGEGARLVVSDWGGGALAREDAGHEEQRRFVQDMLGDDAFYWATLEPGSRVLSAREIAEFGLVTGP